MPTSNRVGRTTTATTNHISAAPPPPPPPPSSSAAAKSSPESAASENVSFRPVLVAVPGTASNAAPGTSPGAALHAVENVVEAEIEETDDTEAISKHGFRFRGETASGRTIAFRTRSKHAGQAQLELEYAGVRVEDLRPARALGRSRNRIPNLDELAALAESIAMQTAIGEPLAMICTVTGEKSPNRTVGAALLAAADGIRNGKFAADSFAAQLDSKGRSVFPRQFIYALRIGEANAEIPELMTRYAALARKKADNKRQVKSAMMYPVGVLAASLLITAGIIYFVVPKLAEGFSEMTGGAGLPFLTRIVIGASHFLASVWGAATVAALTAGGVFLIRWARTPAGADWTGRKVLWLPVIGEINRLYHAAATARNLALLFKGNSDLKFCLAEAAAVAENPVYREMLEDVLTFFRRESRELAVLFAPYADLMGDEFATVTRTFDKTGMLERLFNNYADELEKKVDHQVTSLLKSMETWLIAAVAIPIVVVVISMYLPMFDMIGRMAGK